jgi:benzil reductase ((S)-benzoin forming)
LNPNNWLKITNNNRKKGILFIGFQQDFDRIQDKENFYNYTFTAKSRSMSHYIITGTSRGIGEAIANKLLRPGNTLFCTSRNVNKELVERSVSIGAKIFYFTNDLSDPDTVAEFASQVWSRITPDNVERIALINNAGMLSPIGPIQSNDPAKLAEQIHLNLLAPMLLTSSFVEHTANLNIPKTILNISSGAANSPYFGWSAYCSSKAAIDMFTKTVALEQSFASHPIKVISIAPGIVETAMQSEIRRTNQDDFREVEKFVMLHKEGKLLSPERVAESIVNALFDDTIVSGSVTDIWHLKN